eukprot:8981686-Pyramimonas_sp.AAC.1
MEPFFAKEFNSACTSCRSAPPVRVSPWGWAAALRHPSRATSAEKAASNSSKSPKTAPRKASSPTIGKDQSSAPVGL